MDKKKGKINVFVSILSKCILLISALIVRRMLIKYIGSEANGLNSLFISIIGFLSVAELGVGSAITFCMYKPIIDNNEKTVCGLYNLFKKSYQLIGIIIFVLGIITTPFLHLLVNDISSININIYITFIIMLISVVLTYTYSAKISLINAYKNNYISTLVYSTGMLLQHILQIITIILTKSFVLYLLCRIIAVLFQQIIVSIIANNKYKNIIHSNEKIDLETKKQVFKNIKAMFIHKIGGVLVNTADSVIISAFIGVIILGKYSNYTTIMSSMVAVITLFFSPLTSVIGHLYAKDNKSETIKYYNFFHTMNFIIGIVFFLGYFATIDDIVYICFGNNLKLSNIITFVITLNYFIQFMKQSTIVFRDATGTFYYDRWKPPFEALLNVILSILFVKLFPNEYNVVGVIVATIITNLLICHIIEPLVLFKYAFKTSVKKQYLNNYSYFVIFTICLMILNVLKVSFENPFVELLINGSISIFISIIIIIFVYIINRDFRYYVNRFFNKFISRIKNNIVK